jgi:hypothetical protein
MNELHSVVEPYEPDASMGVHTDACSCLECRPPAPRLRCVSLRPDGSTEILADHDVDVWMASLSRFTSIRIVALDWQDMVWRWSGTSTEERILTPPILTLPFESVFVTVRVIPLPGADRVEDVRGNVEFFVDAVCSNSEDESQWFVAKKPLAKYRLKRNAHVNREYVWTCRLPSPMPERMRVRALLSGFEDPLLAQVLRCSVEIDGNVASHCTSKRNERSER